MPIYEYQCEECGHRLEVIQKFSDSPLTQCPNCKGRLSKILSPSALMFKGSGWYVTDYSSKGKPPKTESEPPKAEKAEAKDKAEVKPSSEKTAEKSSSESTPKTPSEPKESPSKK